MRSFDPSRRSLPFNEWPDPDRVAWNRAIHRGSALEDAGRGAKWAPDTRVRYIWAYGRWLRFLTDRGELDGSVAPVERLSKERLLAWVDLLRAQDLASSTISSYLESLHNTIWGMCPEADIGFLRDLSNYLVTTARPKKSKAGRLWPIDAVYEAALAMMDDADRTPPPRPLWDSTRYRDGLMIAVLCATALRRKNIASLCVDRHLKRHEHCFYLSIPGEEMKNGQPIEGELPKSLTPYLDRYLAHHRPRLLQGRDHDRLWLTREGDPFTRNTVSGRVVKVSTRLGYPMTSHDFRTSAATTIAEVAPELARTIGPFLGHRGQHTSELYYNKAQMLVSARRYADSIMARRARSASEVAAHEAT